MKFTTSQLVYFFRNKTTKRNVKSLMGFLGALAAMIISYSVLLQAPAFLPILPSEKSHRVRAMAVRRGAQACAAPSMGL
jgi:hypothetical protein